MKEYEKAGVSIERADFVKKNISKIIDGERKKNFFEEEPDRIEQLQFQFKLIPFEKLTKEEISMIEKVGTFDIEERSKEGDIWEISFNLDIGYYGNSILLLNTVEKLLEGNKTCKIKTEELKLGKCLIQNVLNKIEKIEKRLGKAK